MKEYCSCSSQLVAGPSSLGSGALPYLIFSQVAALQNGQLLLQGLQFPHLSGKVLLVLFPHGIFQEPGTKVGVWHVTKVGLPSVGGALRARVEWAEKSKAPQCCAQGPLKETSDGLGELGEGKAKKEGNVQSTGARSGQIHVDNILHGASSPDLPWPPGFLSPPPGGSAQGKDLARSSSSWSCCHRLTGHSCGGSIVCSSRWACDPWHLGRAHWLHSAPGPSYIPEGHCGQPGAGA